MCCARGGAVKNSDIYAEATRKPLLENILNTHRHLIFLSNEEKTKYLFFNNQIGNPTLLSASTLLWELFVARTALLKEV